MQENQKFNAWCLIELFGHQVIVGKVSEQSIGGETFIRVDVPKTDKVEAYTKLYGKGAIYCLTPVSEEAASHLIERHNNKPITVFAPKLLQEIPEQEEPGYDERPF